MSTALRKNRAIISLLAVFLITGGIYSVATPIFEAGDEIWHYPFVQFLATGHGLPVQDPARRDLWAQEGGQPPLYYALSAATTFWINTRDLNDRLWQNPYAKIGIPLAFGNKNLIVHTSAEDWPWQGTTLAVHLIRVLSLVLGAGTVLLTYLLAHEITSPRTVHPRVEKGADRPVEGEGRAGLDATGWRSGVAIFAAALVAFNPMFLFISASVNNDSLAVVLASLALLLMVRLARRGLEWHRLLVVGIVCGLGALSKVSDLGLLPLALLVAGWLAWVGTSGRTTTRLRQAFFNFILPAALITMPALVIAGWWYARNYLLYGDPFAFNIWVRISGGRATPVTLLRLLDEFQGFRISFWGNFGGVNLIAWDWVYIILDILTVAAIVGLALGGYKRTLPPLLFIPALWLTIVVAGLVRWTLITYASQGRLIFPAIGAVAVLLAFGLSNLGTVLFSAFRTYRVHWFRAVRFPDHAASQPANLVACVFLFAFAIATPFLIIEPAYALPPRLPHDTAAPNPVHISYAAVGAQPELVGYEVGRSVQAGGDLPLTLYWRTSGAVLDDLYVYVHLYDAADNPAGQWEAYPGNGLYPVSLWQPNEMIVDRYRVPVSSLALGPQVGRVEVGLTRVGFTVPLPARNPSGDTIVPTIARFKIAAPPSSFPAKLALFQFSDQLAMVNLQLSGSRGGRVFEIDPGHSSEAHVFGADVLHAAYTLRALREPDDDYSLFVHVVDQGDKILVQRDAPPGGAAYPTSFWDAGESVDGLFDLPIPNGAPAGDYKVEIGLYHSNGGARLPVQGKSIGNLVAAGDHLLLSPLPIGK